MLAQLAAKGDDKLKKLMKISNSPPSMKRNKHRPNDLEASQKPTFQTTRISLPKIKKESVNSNGGHQSPPLKTDKGTYGESTTDNKQVILGILRGTLNADTRTHRAKNRDESPNQKKVELVSVGNKITHKWNYADMLMSLYSTQIL